MRKHRLLLKEFVNQEGETKLYLCKTVRKDWERYRGSGLDVTEELVLKGTTLLGEFETNEELAEVGLELSVLWEVENNDLFLNRCPESGQGGHTNYNEESFEKKTQTVLRKYGRYEGAFTAHRKVKEKYGVENPFLVGRKETWLKKYGVENPQQNSEVRAKTEKTNEQKYGVKTPLLLEENREKQKVASKTSQPQRTASLLKKGERPVVREVKELQKQTGRKLKQGWVLMNEEFLELVRDELKELRDSF